MDGALALMATRKSVKRGEQIGRFGLGFKSVLAVSDAPRFFSRSGSLVYDRAWSRQELERVVPGREHYPATRLARPVDAAEWRRSDPVLDDLMSWATSVVSVPIRARRDVLASSVRIFPAEFLLFSPHVATLELKDRRVQSSRRVTLSPGRGRTPPSRRRRSPFHLGSTEPDPPPQPHSPGRRWIPGSTRHRGDDLGCPGRGGTRRYRRLLGLLPDRFVHLAFRHRQRLLEVGRRPRIVTRSVQRRVVD